MLNKDFKDLSGAFFSVSKFEGCLYLQSPLSVKDCF